MDFTAVIVAVLGLSGTLVAGYYTFRAKLEELKAEAKVESRTAIRTANELMFQQIQVELTRRDGRINHLEGKIAALETERETRQIQIQVEQELNRKLSDQLEEEQERTAVLESQVIALQESVRQLKRENTALKKQVGKIETDIMETGMLNSGSD